MGPFNVNDCGTACEDNLYLHKIMDSPYKFMQTKENNHYFFFVCISFCTFIPSRVITLKHNNEELRNTNGCYLVTQFPCNPNNRLILR